MGDETERTEVVKHDDVSEVMKPGDTDRSALPSGMLEPVDDPGAIVRGREKRSRLITEALQEGRDYGSVRGIPKPFLHKPGAERLTDAFGCYPRFKILDSEIDHDRRTEWEKRSGDTGTSRGLYRYVVSCELVHRASGIVVGNGLGACSTMEDKYVESPRNAENTCLKMAKKRAHVDAALSTFGLSEMFTQDEDYVKNAGGGRAPSGEADTDHACPDCGGPIWDNRADKKAGEVSKKYPNFKCQDRDCDWASWDSEDEVFGSDEGYQWADPLEDFPELQSALGELETLNETRAANARDWLEGLASEMADNPQAVQDALDHLEKGISEERGGGEDTSGAEPEAPASEDEDGPDKSEWEDRTYVLDWFEDTYADPDAKLRTFLVTHPEISVGGEPAKLDKMGWNRIKRFVDEHGHEGVGDPRQYVQTEAAL